MISISPEALALIEEKKVGIFIEAPRTIRSCCIEVTECPSVRFGVPRVLVGYIPQLIQGVTVQVPDCFPAQGDFVIRVGRFLGFRWLRLDGWRLV